MMHTHISPEHNCIFANKRSQPDAITVAKAEDGALRELGYGGERDSENRYLNLVVLYCFLGAHTVL
jgi:hypothetical protein